MNTKGREFVVEASGEPVSLTFGPPQGKHAVAIVRPKGVMVFHPDASPSSQLVVDGHELVGASWVDEPNAAAATYELRDGDAVLKTLEFPSQNDSSDTPHNPKTAEDWAEVKAFMQDNGIKFFGVGEAYFQSALRTHLGRSGQRLPGGEFINPYGNRRADFNLCDFGFIELRIADSKGKTIAVIPPAGRSDEQMEADGRILSFAGKTHWALGTACARFRAMGQDLRMLATIVEKDPARAKVLIEQLAADAYQIADVEHKAYEGALLMGEDAKKFDAEWHQDGIVEGRPDLHKSPYAQRRPLPTPTPSAAREFGRD